MKLCPKCNITKSFDEFHVCKSKKSGYQTYCKVCLLENIRADYKKRPEVYLERSNKRRKVYFDLLNRIRVYFGCQICGEKEACCLDFHHIDSDTKVSEVSYLAHCKNRHKILEEIKKCAVICANCHRKIHAGMITIELKPCELENVCLN